MVLRVNKDHPMVHVSGDGGNCNEGEYDELSRGDGGGW